VEYWGKEARGQGRAGTLPVLNCQGGGGYHCCVVGGGGFWGGVGGGSGFRCFVGGLGLKGVVWGGGRVVLFWVGVFKGGGGEGMKRQL